MKKKKNIAIISAISGGVLLLGILLFLILGGNDASKNKGFTQVVTNINNVTIVNENKIVYDDGDGLKMTIEPATEKDKEAVKSGKTGTTRDGATWKSNDDVIVVEDKKLTVEKNSKKKDDAKVAAVATALNTQTGYTKGVTDYNPNYAVYYIEEAECLFYYPKQLTLVKEGEDLSLLFRDTRSKAELKVKLSENDFKSMDEVESLIANSEQCQILASGTDWFSAESYGKGTTTFSLTGLGNKYAVTADFTYENKYNFVFNNLRKLIKCKFINDGVWVSNAKKNTTGKKVAALAKNASNYDPYLQRTSYFSKDLNCVIAYPDIFSKVYDDGSSVSLTDPVTGANIVLNVSETSKQIEYYMERYSENGAELVSDHSLRADLDGTYIFITIGNGRIWTANMNFDPQYKGVYSDAYKMLEISIPGEAINNTEMQDIFFPDYNCFIRVPLQFVMYSHSGRTYNLRDEFTGMESVLYFTEVDDTEDYNDLFKAFNVVAKDNAVVLGEDSVKWHNNDGLFIGGAGRKYSALLDISSSNAFDVYETCWKNFDICFCQGDELITDAEEIRKEAQAETILNTARKEQLTEESDSKEYYAKAKKSAQKAKSNVAKTLEKKGKEPEKQVVKNKKREPNKVLFYKTQSDYTDVITSGDEWIYDFKEIFPDPDEREMARFYTILFSMNVLEYNGYTMPDDVNDVDDVLLVADDVDTLVQFLEESGEEIDSQLGEGVISVFEVLCFYLGIDDVPVYVIENYDPSSTFEQMTQADSSKKDPHQSGDPDPSDEDPRQTGDPDPSDEDPRYAGDPDPSDAYEDEWDTYNFFNKKTAREALSIFGFDSIPGFREEDSVFGSLSYLVLDNTKTSVKEVRNAIQRLEEHDYECTYRDTDSVDIYCYKGFIPNTEFDITIFIHIDYEIRVFIISLYHLGDNNIPSLYTYPRRDYDYTVPLSLSYQFPYIKKDIERMEGAAFKNASCLVDFVETDVEECNLGQYLQHYDPERDDHIRTLLTIDVEYPDEPVYTASGEFYYQTYTSHTYVYLPTEGETVMLWESKGITMSEEYEAQHRN